MATVPIPPNLSAGTLVTAAQMNQLSAMATFLLTGRPICIAQANATQALTLNTRNLIKMQTKVYDNDSIFSTGGNPPFIIQTNGWYRGKYHVPLASTNCDCGILVTTGSGNPQGAGVTNYCWGSGATQDAGGSAYIAASGGGLIPYYLYATDTVQVGLSPNTSVSTVLTDAAAMMSLEWMSA